MNIYKEIIKNNSDMYRKNLLDGDPDKSISAYARTMRLFRSLSDEDQNAIIDLLRIASVDAVSVLLGGIDGSTDLGALDGDFILKYKDEEVQGGLQNDFWEVVEDANIM